MESIFEKWKTRIPKYSERYKGLFDSLATKYGAEGEKKISLGKHFSTNYELYIYAFFLGLYYDEEIPYTEGEKKLDFSHHIQFWGNKGSRIERKDFSKIQDYIFAATISKANINFIALEKGEISEEDVIKKLIAVLESYTNGGLNIINEKIEDLPDFFLQPTSFLELILNAKEKAI